MSKREIEAAFLQSLDAENLRELGVGEDNIGFYRTGNIRFKDACTVCVFTIVFSPVKRHVAEFFLSPILNEFHYKEAIDAEIKKSIY